ncbi:hypothetical protein EXIGLDRAFT_145234 [Exidia glandulosa HHB12029]|uniref:Uncharacterized protein n=1 Tax=Exidia glandulosa HHB12029 TaxID=1314781 RepID=A0A165ND32_EXIGL|nr:hypothetical protein EXIGLDRAFT_145234 [Exidia glandulosa HHB12029]
MDAVHDVATLDVLLGQFESYNSVSQLATIIPDLINQPLALEVVLAATDAPVQCIRLAFPDTAALFASALDGHYPTLLRRLADAPLLPALVAALDRETNLDLGRRRRKVHTALECLQILEDSAFPAARDATLNEDPDADDEDEDTTPFSRQKRRKKNKRAQRAELL